MKKPVKIKVKVPAVLPTCICGHARDKHFPGNWCRGIAGAGHVCSCLNYIPRRKNGPTPGIPYKPPTEYITQELPAAPLVPFAEKLAYDLAYDLARIGEVHEGRLTELHRHQINSIIRRARVLYPKKPSRGKR